MSIGPRRVRPGEPFRPSASAWNAMADFVARHTGGVNGAGPPFPSGVVPSLKVLVRNDTGGDLPIRSVLTPTAPVESAIDLPSQVQAVPYLAADAPAAETDPVVVAVEPIDDGAVGLAVILGLAVVDVDVNDAGHTFAVPAAGQTLKLESAAEGQVKILWRDSGASGTKRAVVLIGAGSGSGDTNSVDIVTEWEIVEGDPCTIVPSLVRTITGVFTVGAEHAP